MSEEQAMSEDQDWAGATEQAVLDAAVARAGELGWSARLLAQAGAACGLSAGDVELLFPNGPRDLAALLSRRHDARALAALGDDFDRLKIREKIARLVEARIEAATADEAAVRRWSGFLALPPHAALGLRLAWESADALWRRAGDVAADENHYSKRAILAGILIPALQIRLAQGPEAARAFTAARIENVMAYEKLKAKVRLPFGPDQIVQGLARLRYGTARPGPEA
jgi:ubiquinone biosynthesis protein COQ9